MSEGLEGRVRKIAAEAAAQKAERDRIPQGAEYENMVRDYAAILHEESVAEEKRTAIIRKERGVVTEKITEIEALRTQLEEVHAVARDSMRGAVEAKAASSAEEKAISELLAKLQGETEMAAVLKSLHISSVHDLLTHSGFEEEGEVVAVKKARDARTLKRTESAKKVIERSAVKRSAREKLEEEGKVVREDGKLPSYAAVVAGMKELVQELDAKRKELHYQTPEGEKELADEIAAQEKAEREMILSRVAKRRESYGIKNLITREGVHAQATFDHGDLEDAKVYGEEKVKDSIKGYYRSIVDVQIEKEAEESGQSEIKEAINTFDALPRRWAEVRRVLNEVNEVRGATALKLAESMGTPESLVFKAVQRFGNFQGTDATRLAEAFVYAWSSYNTSTYNMSFHAVLPEQVVEKIIDEQEALLPLASSQEADKKQKVFPISRQDMGRQVVGRYETALLNPEVFARILSEQVSFYKKFEAVVADSDTFLSLLKKDRNDDSLQNALAVRGEVALGIDGRSPGSVEKKVIIKNPKAYMELRDYRLDMTRQNILRAEAGRATRSLALKEQVGYKVEADWAHYTLEEFRNMRLSNSVTHNTLIEEVRQKERMRTSYEMQKLVPSFRRETAASSDIGNFLQERVVIENGGVHFEDASPAQLRALQGEVTKAQEVVDAKNRALKDIEARITKGYGMLDFGRQKGKDSEEKVRLQGEKETADVALVGALEQLLGVQAKRGTLTILNEWLTRARADHFQPELPKESVTLEAFVADITKQMRFELTPEQAEEYAEYQRLEQSNKEAREAYDMAYRGRH